MCASHFKLARKEWVYTCCNANSIAKSGNHYGIEKKNLWIPVVAWYDNLHANISNWNQMVTLFRRRFKYHIDNII
jgi:hypothetical protein